MGMFDFLPSADSLTPDFSDPNKMAIFGALGNLLMAGGTPIRGMSGLGAGNALAMLGGAGMQGAVSGAQGAQAFQKSNIENKVGQLGLERQQAIQPYQISMIKNMMSGNGPGGGGLSGLGSGPNGVMTPGDQLGAQALMAAYASGDMKQVSQVFTSLYEHNPALAGAIKAAQEGSSVHETPQGPQFGIQGLPGAPSGGGFGALVPTSPAPTGLPSSQVPAPIAPMNASALDAGSTGPNPTPPTPNQIPNNPFAAPGIKLDAPAPRDGGTDNSLQSIIASQQTKKAGFTPADGKPILDGINDNYSPDIHGQPHFTTANTTNGVEKTNELQKTAIAQDTEFNATGPQTAQMLARLHDMMSAATSGQMGTLIAQDPELAQKAVAAGLIKDGKMTNDLAQIQRFGSDQMMEVINQLKMTNAGPGGGKLMRAEVMGAAEKMADPKQQPQAIHDILAIGEGLANYNQDMLRAWQSEGGLGNSLKNGDSMLAQEFQSRFSTTHDVDDYINLAKKSMPAFKGMDVPPMKDAKKGYDGNWYVPDPNRPGKHMRVVQ